MNTPDILKMILEQNGPITITEIDPRKVKDKQIGMIQSWDDDGKITWTIYAHEGAIRK